ncbi:hypothetical protein Z043_113299, partial [Scleropages formosus]
MDCIESCWNQERYAGVYSCPQCRQTFISRPVLGRNTMLAEVNKAVKSCLVCLASYCESHLELHNELIPGKRHELTVATRKLQDNVCSHHDKLLEVGCRTDQQCICLLCVMDEHRGHDTVSAATGRTNK